jgi:Baseplate J-like protein
MQQVIQLTPEDDAASIRAKIDAAELSHLVLVVPRGCIALETEHGVRMLRRAADDAGAQVAVVAHDEDVRDRAEQFGMPSFSSIAQAQRTHWRMKPQNPDGVQSMLNPPPPENVSRGTIDPTELIKRWWGTLIVIVAACMLLCMASVLVVPAANVHIVPSSVALTMTSDVLLDASLTQVSTGLNAIPGQRIFKEISTSGQLKTTTTKNLPDARASGTVVFTNLTSEQVTIPPNTVLKTSTGVPVRFTTVTTATVPAGANSHVEAQINAVDPGPSGNVNALAINNIEGSLNLQVRVINLKPTVSGTVHPVRVVTQDDEKKLQAQVMRQLTQLGAAELQKGLSPTEFIAPDSIQINPDSIAFDHVVDDPADALNLRIAATAFGMGVDRNDLVSVAGMVLQKQVQPGYALLPNGVQVDPQPGGKYNGVLFKLPYHAVGYTTPQIDASRVASALQGKSIDDAKTYLSSAINLAQPPEINVTPPGWFRMPWFAFRIAVFAEPPPVVQP